MRTRDIGYVALFAAFTVVLGLIPPLEVPVLPVPITSQTLGVMLAGAVLGARRAGLALLVFVVLVAIGLPVLAGGRGGLGVLFGPSGGFILSWPIGAFVTGLLTERFWRRYNMFFGIVANFVGGVLVVYLFGIPFLATVGGAGMSALYGSAVFLPGDIVKVVIAAAVAVSVRRAYPLIEARHP